MKKKDPLELEFNDIASFVFQLKYPAGYGLALVSYVQMAIICLTGQNCIDRVNVFLVKRSKIDEP